MLAHTSISENTKRKACFNNEIIILYKYFVYVCRSIFILAKHTKFEGLDPKGLTKYPI